MRRDTVCFLAACCTLLFAPSFAEACSCVGPQAPCEATWQADVVLVAQVVRIEELQSRRRVHLMPLEVFRGPSNILSVETGMGGGDCGYAFRTGDTYLIYAGASTGRYYTGICHRTRRLRDATDDLDYLHTAARTPSNVGVIRGTVFRDDPNYDGPGQRRPFPGIRVSVSGSRDQQETRTDDVGRYEVWVAPGEYEVSVDVPDGLYDTARVRRVQLRDGRGCSEADVFLHSDGRIRGRVLDARGQPVIGLPLELLTRVSYGYGYSRVGSTTSTTSDGSYQFTRVGPGSFYIALDTLRPDPARRGQTQRVFLPGTLDGASAADVRLRPEERIRVADFILPETSGVVHVSGVVRSDDGQAIEGANVYLRVAPPTSLFFFGPPAVTSANGEFALLVPGDVVYVVTIELPKEPQRTRGLQQPTIRPSQGDTLIEVVIPRQP